MLLAERLVRSWHSSNLQRMDYRLPLVLKDIPRRVLPNVQQTNSIRTSFPRSCCEGCPHQGECLASIKVNTAVVNIPLTSWKRVTELASDQDNEFRAFIARLWNGVETIPSILRRKYHVDEMPVRGKLKTKIRFGFKLLALNFSKLWLYTKGLEKCRAFEG